MSANGYVLHKELPAAYGFFTELKPYENPITTLVGRKGIRILENKDYGMTFHTNAEASSANLKPDNSSATLGSSGFTTGSNCCQIWDEGAADTFARRGDQNLSRTLGYNNPSNPSVEPTTLQRGLAEAMAKIKSELEYVAREGVYNSPASAGTTGTWQQRGYRYADGITVGTASGAVAGAGTLGTLGTLSYDVTMDTLQDMWSKRLWEGGRPMTAVCNATVKRQLTDIFKDEFNFGQNGQLINESGVNLLRFITDFGPVDILLTHNFPGNDLYFLNLDYMEMVGRPVPGKGLMFLRDVPQTTTADVKSWYTEMGMNYQTGSAHGRIFGIGSAVIGGQTVS